MGHPPPPDRGCRGCQAGGHGWTEHGRKGRAHEHEPPRGPVAASASTRSAAPHRPASRVRRHAADRRGHLGPAEGTGQRARGAAAGGGPRRRLHRHRRLLRPVRQRGAHPRGALPVPRRHRRHQGRPAAHRTQPLDPVRAPGLPAPGGRDEPAPPRRGDPRPLPAPPRRPARRRRRAVRPARRPAARGQGPRGRPEPGLRRRDRGGREASSTSRRCRTATTSSTAPRTTCCATAPRTASGSCRGRRPTRASSPSRATPRTAPPTPRRHGGPGRAGVAAAAQLGDAADPGHQLARAPRGELRGRVPRARPRDRRDAGRRRS